jgi:hypothetical protein
MIELQVEEEVDFDDALFSISFQMTGDENAGIQDMQQMSHGTSSYIVCWPREDIDKTGAMCNTSFTLLSDEEVANYKYKQMCINRIF